MSISLIRPRKLCEELGIPMSTLYRWLDDDPTFPKRVQLGTKAVAFRRDDVEEWIESRTRQEEKVTA